MTPEQIAAEVSARYGIPVSPAAVKIIPAGQMATHVEYCWYATPTGGGVLRAVDPSHKPIKKLMEAQWQNRERAQRIAKAAKPKEAHPKYIRSKRLQDEVRAIAATGGTYDQIAARMKWSLAYTYKFCAKWKIEVTPRMGGTVATAPARAEKIREFADNGQKYLHEIAAFMGVTKKSAASYLKDKGIPYKTMQTERRAA